MEPITNTQDVIDSRDIIERIAELKEIRDTIETEWASNPDNAGYDFARYARNDVNWSDELEDELAKLEALAAECGGVADWEYGETLIRYSYFKDYAQELAEDCGMIPEGLSWPCNCIDWDQAARELQYDYMLVEFDGVDYWIRNC